MNAPKWHVLDAATLAESLSTHTERGLSQEEAAMRLSRQGPNEIRTRQGYTYWGLVKNQIASPIVYLLLIAAAVALLLQRWTDAVVVAAAVVINGIIGFLQELKANRAIEAVSQLVPEFTSVVRDGEKRLVPSREIVPGDVVELLAGDKVPADLRILAASSARAEEGVLTGESVPVDKRASVLASEIVLGDRVNMLFGGTHLVAGSVRGVVVSTGRTTELGRISELLSSTRSSETPLVKALGHMGSRLTIVIAVLALLIVVAAFLRGYPMTDALIIGVGLAVASIPEGLPAIVTIILAVGVRHMAARRAVVRLLPSVETLGSTTVICTDKTGTLTRNEMTVQRLWTPSGGERYVSGVGYAAPGEILEHDAGPALEPEAGLRRLLEAGVCCNDSNLVEEQSGLVKVAGDPTEGALLVSARKGKVESLLASQRRQTLPFDSMAQYMATLHAEGDESVVFLKGAPEVVLARCSDRLAAHRCLGEAERLANQGLRVLAFAEKRVGADTRIEDADSCGNGFVLLGLQAMWDPPREEAVEAVSDCHRAGIRVKMITGDHKNTAINIAHRIGISDDERVLTGAELEQMSDAELGDVLPATHVFARVAPEHKIRLVKLLQERGEVVAMTGDGVNDAPALKRADIGVAMGITGSAVSKEASAIVLSDDNFATIRAAIEEGRRVYDNLVKALAFLLPTNLGQGLIILFSVLLFPSVDGRPLLPILPIQILWINLVCAVGLSIPLAFESKEPDVMLRPPRDPREPILNRLVVFRTVMVALLMSAAAMALFLYEFRLESSRGVPFEVAVAEAQTIAVSTVVLMQAFYLFSCRSLRSSMTNLGVFSNPSVFVGVALVGALQLFFVYGGFMNGVFGSAPLNLDAWSKVLLAGVSVIPLMAVDKWFRRHPLRMGWLERNGSLSAGLLLILAGLGFLLAPGPRELAPLVPIFIGMALSVTGLVSHVPLLAPRVRGVEFVLGLLAFADALYFFWRDTPGDSALSVVASKVLLGGAALVVIIVSMLKRPGDGSVGMTGKEPSKVETSKT